MAAATADSAVPWTGLLREEQIALPHSFCETLIILVAGGEGSKRPLLFFSPFSFSLPSFFNSAFSLVSDPASHW